MCGITGFFTRNNPISEQDLRSMTDALAHRGPDASGYYTQDKVGLGHRRLSVIDLSTASDQPMYSSCGRYVIAFNGEVYNFKEIAEELNIPLKTTGDTEVVIEAFAKWGPDMVNKLNGMFAMAIYDQEKEELFVFRDRMGIKPIYYYWNDGQFLFASELKALLTMDSIKGNLEIDKEALSHYLYLGYVPEPWSIYRSIKKFPAASWLKVNADEFSLQPYWSLEEQITEQVWSDENEAKAELKRQLEKSVEYRLMADVPFGTFLSGGIDSSLVTAAAQAVSSKPINTFSIGFTDAGFNEAEHAKKVANHLGTKHHEFYVGYNEALELFDDILDVYDEPFADSSSVPTMLVSKLAREHVTMTLSGDGGDESFLGYGSYVWADRLSNPLVKLGRKPIAKILSQLPPKYERASHLFQYPNSKRKKSHIFSQEQYYFTEEELDGLVKPDFKHEITFDESFEGLARDLSPMEEQALFDMKFYLKDDLLVKVDRASMRYSLENRVPLLDHNLVSFALNVDASLKMKGKSAKHLLKEVLYDYVPKKYFDRPKWGFGMPIGNWLNKELKYLVDEYLSSEVIKKAGLVKEAPVRELLKGFSSGKYYLYNRIWLLILLHKWYLKQFD